MAVITAVGGFREERATSALRVGVQVRAASMYPSRPQQRVQVGADDKNLDFISIGLFS